MSSSNTAEEPAGLFGIKFASHDFTKKSNWGKNKFNNAFPVALACYMHSRGIKPVYLRLDEKGEVAKSEIGVDEVFGMNPADEEDVYYAFERDYSPYQPLVEGKLPGTDLVIMHNQTRQSIQPIEIKLTALPDNSTATLDDAQYGCEIVVRPDTIVYLALSIAETFRNDLEALRPFFDGEQNIHIEDWTDPGQVIHEIPVMVSTLNRIMAHSLDLQQPVVVQPVWKSQGQLLALHDDAFDIFVWSNYAFTRLFFRSTHTRSGINRNGRTAIWLYKMLKDFAESGKINHKVVIDALTYNTRNDKAFSVNGKRTHPLMKSNELTTPRVKRDEIKYMIRGDGQKYLSPERRLDAAILGTPGLFD